MEDFEEGKEEVLSCELCNVNPTSHEDLQAHLRGRAHMVMVQRSEVAERSVYVRGFSNVPSAKDDLCEVMGQFGGVVSVAVVSTGPVVYALVEFASVESALRALRHSSPLTLHGHNLRIKPRILKTNKIQKRKVVQCRKKRLDVSVGITGESASEEGGGREGGGEKEVEEEVVVVGGIRLTPEAAVALSQSHSVDLQLQTLASHCRLGNTTAENQLLLACELQAKFRCILPSCVVIPFGAPFSGHGTLSSDCDLCLLSRPSPLDYNLFLTPTYLPSHLHTFWDQLHLTQPMPPPPSVERETQSGETQSEEPGLEEVLAVLQVDQSCSRVRAVRNARVPIIRFTAGHLHCDLSLNNRLGPANTRLLGAYMTFDPRMAILVPCVRLWVRGWGFGRSLLNNYAVSLMLICSLQHTTPPVLPCLQEPGMWPRNMAWIGSRGLLTEHPVTLHGWDCSFIDPLSLLPSSNTASAAQLLLHFFKYFSEDFSFSDHMVGIHTTSPPLVSHADRSPGFRVSAFCVQDPFELGHNVTKSMNAAHLARLVQALRSSRQLLAELLDSEQSDPSKRQNILSFFRPPANHPLPDQHATATHSLQLDLQIISRLLHNTRFAALQGRLEELDLSNGFVHQQLNHVLLHSLTHHFLEDFGVKSQFPDFSEVCKTPCETPGVPHPPQTEVEVKTSLALQRKRERSTEEGGEEEMEVEVEEGGGGFEVKRRRLDRVESAEELLCHLTEGEALTSRAECVAEEQSWLGTRRRRRQQQREDGGSASASPQTPSPPPATHCLSFFLLVPFQHQSNTTTTVVLQASHPKFKLAFELFFSVFKKRYFH